MKILITGAAGFIGFHMVTKCLENGHTVVGLDNINNYYDTTLKYDRLKETGIDVSGLNTKLAKSNKWPSYNFIKLDLVNNEALSELFEHERFDLVIHLAAQAGVRFSLEQPGEYIQSNIIGFFNVLEACRHFSIEKLLYASSSSVYGMSENKILSVSDRTDYPVSLYAATKKSNEVMAHSYSHLFNITTIGLRFFTVYGPWGRPDMAPFLFANAITQGLPIKVFNNGQLQRDFTFIDDIVEGIYGLATSRVLKKKYYLFNIGNQSPVKLLDFIECLEQELDRKSLKDMVDMQPGDVFFTCADISELIDATGYRPTIDIRQGVKKFVNWYRDYYKISMQ